MNQIQLLGDSMVNRLKEHIRRSDSGTVNIKQSIGISGARIQEVKKFLKQERIKFDPGIKLLIFVGTNDIFKNSQQAEMQNQFKSLLKLIRRQSPGLSVIISQLPVYPRARNSHTKMQNINEFNQFLSTLANENTAILSPSTFLDIKYDFHKYYSYSLRVDGIHLNDRGNKIFLSHLKRKLFM